MRVHVLLWWCYLAAAFRAQSGQRAQTSVGSKVIGGSNKCPRCDKAVYHAEKLTALSRVSRCDYVFAFALF